MSFMRGLALNKIAKAQASDTGSGELSFWEVMKRVPATFTFGGKGSKYRDAILDFEIAQARGTEPYAQGLKAYRDTLAANAKKYTLNAGAIGGSAGALAGGALGALIDRRNRLRGMLIGAVGGGVLSALGSGYWFGRSDRDHANDSDRTRKEYEDMMRSKINEHLNKYTV